MVRNVWSLYSAHTPSGGSKWNGTWLRKWCGNGCAEVSLWGWESRSLRTHAPVVLELVGGWAEHLDSWSHEHPHKPFYLLSLCMAVSWVHLFFEFWCVFSTSVCAVGLEVQNSLETTSVWRLQHHERHSKTKLASNFFIKDICDELFHVWCRLQVWNNQVIEKPL